VYSHPILQDGAVLGHWAQPSVLQALKIIIWVLFMMQVNTILLHLVHLLAVFIVT
jgi:hypothetical protein